MDSTWRTLRLGLLAVFGALFAAVSIWLGAPARAEADNCESIPWGLHFLTPQWRGICDGPIRPDGSWERARALYTPAHRVPIRTNCFGTYYVSCTTTGGYWQELQVWEKDVYTVFPSNVLPNEPGHLGS